MTKLFSKKALKLCYFSHPKIIAISTLVVGVFTTSAYSFDLKEAWKAAETHSSELQKNRYEFEANQQQLPITRAALLPQIGANISYQKQKQSLPSSITRNSQSWRVSASQTIFNLNKWYKYQGSKFAVIAAENQFDLAKQQLLLRVAEAYFNALIAQESLITIQKAQQSFLTQQRQAEAQFKKGATTIVDVQEAQTGYESAVADEIEVTSQLVQANAQLKTYTGLDIDQIEQINDYNLINFPWYTSEQWIQLVDKNNFEIKLQAAVTEQTKQELKAIQAYHVPTIEMSTGLYRNPNDYQSSDLIQDYDTKASYIGVGLSIPIFSGGETRAQTKQANATYLAAKSELDMIREKTHLSATENFAKVRAGKMRIKALEKLVLTSKTKVSSSTLGQKYGLLNNTDKIRAEKEYYEAQLKLTQAKYEYLQAQLNLMQLAGLFNINILNPH